MMQSDTVLKCTSKKLSLRHTVIISMGSYSFVLPSHKSDRFFEGSTILIEARGHDCSPHPPFLCYIAARDACFPFHPQLWLRASGEVPTYSWVVQRLKSALGDDVAGHSALVGQLHLLTQAPQTTTSRRKDIGLHIRSTSIDT